jgi:polysaccharide biosynthesis transport protein
MVERQEEQPPISMWLDIVWKQKWLVLAFITLVLTAAVLFTNRQPRIYQAVTQIIVELNAPRYMAGQGNDVVSLGSGNSWNTREFFETQYRIMRSRMVAKKVVQNLGLDKDLGFLGVTKIEDPEKRARRLKNADAISILVGRLSVVPVSDSRVVLIKVRDENPARAARIADAVASAYAAQNVDRKVSAASDAVNWLSKQADSLKNELINAERALLQYKHDNEILGATLADKQNFIGLDLQDARRQLRDARRERVGLRSKLDQVRTLSAIEAQSSVTEILGNGLIQRLKERRVQFQNERADLLKSKLPKHPEVKVIDQKIKRVEKALNQEVKGIRLSLERSHKALAAGETKLASEVGGLEQQAKKLQAHELAYRRLQANLESKKGLHGQMLGRLKEAQLQAETRANNVRVLDAALVPKSPVLPRMLLNLAVAAILALVGSLGLAFFMYRLDNTIKNQQQLEAYGLTFLGIVPSIRSVRGRGGLPKELGNPDRCVIEHPRSSVAECVRIIRTNLLFMASENALGSIMVTSAGPREGKTTTCVNIGATMAMSGTRTLLIDSDLRRPRLHKIFGMTNERGLTNLVMDADVRVADMVKATEVERLDILCSGPLPPNPSELLHTQGFRRTLEKLGNEYDRLIFDSPPIGAVTDAQILGQQVDGTILVVRAGDTRREMVAKATGLLSSVNIRVLGALLNNLDVSQRGYGQYYYQYYRQQGDETTVEQTVEQT